MPGAAASVPVMEIASVVVQTLASLAALLAAGAALWISRKERENTRDIAAADRADAARRDRLMFELTQSLRLLENLARGGSTDPQERKQMGAEALAIIGTLGPDRLPGLWERRVIGEDHLRGHLEDPDYPQWKRDTFEVQFAVNKITDEIAALVGETNPTARK